MKRLIGREGAYTESNRGERECIQSSAGSIPKISNSIRFDSSSEGSIFDLDSQVRSTVKPRVKLQTLSGYHEFSE